MNNFSQWAAEVARRGDVLVRRGGAFTLLDLSQPPEAYRTGSGLNRAFLAELLAENDSEDFALRDMLLTHGAVYLADLEPVLLLQPPLRSFFASASGFASAHTETARMAKTGWFEVHSCAHLDRGDFELPCLPFRTSPSGLTPRKLEPDRWRGVQDFGGPRRPLRELPFLGGMGVEAAHKLAFGRVRSRAERSQPPTWPWPSPPRAASGAVASSAAFSPRRPPCCRRVPRTRSPSLRAFLATSATTSPAPMAWSPALREVCIGAHTRST